MPVRQLRRPRWCGRPTSLKGFQQRTGTGKNLGCEFHARMIRRKVNVRSVFAPAIHYGREERHKSDAFCNPCVNWISSSRAISVHIKSCLLKLYVNRLQC